MFDLNRVKKIYLKLMTRPSQKELDNFSSSDQKFDNFLFVFFREAIALFRVKDVASKSKSLTYSFILAFIPLLTVLFVFFHALGGLKNLFESFFDPLIVRHFGTELGVVIVEFIKSIIDNLETKQLGISSFLTFLITVVLLLASAEDKFNEILGYTKRIPLLKRLMKYWVIITFLPLVIFIVVMNQGSILNFVANDIYIIGLTNELLLSFINFILLSLFICLIFYVLPEKGLNFKSILFGGFFTGLLLTIIQNINSFIISGKMSSNTVFIYGKLSLIVVVVIFLVNLISMSVFIGFVLSASLDRIIGNKKNINTEQNHPFESVLRAIVVYVEISSYFKEYSESCKFLELMGAIKTTEDDLYRSLDWLILKNIIITYEHLNEVSYTPSFHAQELERDPSKLIDFILYSEADLEFIKEFRKKAIESPVFIEVMKRLASKKE